MALSWPHLPCALKAAIGIGKRTLGDPRQSSAPQGPRARPGSVRFREKKQTRNAQGWLNPLCALKAAIGIGKRTLGDPSQSSAP